MGTVRHGNITQSSPCIGSHKQTRLDVMARLLFVLVLLATTTVFVSSSFQAFANASPSGNRIVRVACYENGAYMSKASDGIRTGYNIEYLNELGRYANWTYEFVDYPGFNQAYAATVAGEVDLLAGTHFSDERAQNLLFSENSFIDIYTTLCVRANETRYTYEDFHVFNGMRVGIIEGSLDAQAFINYSLANGFSADIVPFEDTERMLEALDNESIDGVATAHMGSNSNYRIIGDFSPASLYIALPKDRTAFTEELDQAMNKLKIRDPGFFTTLHNRYLGMNTDLDPVFTDDEYAYLATTPVLRVAYDTSRAPLSYTNPETGEFSGVAALLFRDIARITGLTFEFVPVQNHDDMLQQVATGAADIATEVVHSDDDAARGLAGTTGPYLRDPMTLITGGNPEGPRLALLSGTILSTELARLHTGDEITFFDTSKQCIDAVLSGDMDAMYADTHVANYLLAEPQYASLSVTTISDFTSDLSMGVAAHSDPRLLRILDRCVQYTSDSKMTTWLSETSLGVHPTTPLDFMRQYPLQIVSGLVVLFAIILATSIYIGRTKLRTARRIEKASFTDPLTGGWNLARFRAIVDNRLRTMSSGESIAILYLDIARFKSFNAAFGFVAGDELLIALGRLIREQQEEGECFAHITADEYVALVKWTDWETFLRRFAELDKRFDSLEVLSERSHHLFLHAGVCIVDRKSETSRSSKHSLPEYMDCARYARDSLGELAQSEAALYTSGMRDRDVKERAVVAFARDALERGEFVAYYQPKVRIATNRIVSFEALVRWESKDHGLIRPDDFIPLFEKNGFVTEIDLHILNLACTRLRERLDAGKPVVPIACNFSRHHLQHDDFPEHVRAIVDEHRVPVELIEMELTEGIVMEDLGRAQQMCNRLKDLGFRISIDDFGSGYSSLGTLQDLPIDVLKLDRTFLMGEESESSQVILEGVINMAKKLHVTVVVEGVETRKHAALLVHLNDEIIAQGYLYSRPVPRTESDVQLDAGSIEPHER